MHSQKFVYLLDLSCNVCENLTLSQPVASAFCQWMLTSNERYVPPSALNLEFWAFYIQKSDPNERQTMIEVTAAILLESDKLLIARRKPTDKLPLKWEFPGGKIEDNETPEKCLEREMKEEFCIEVSTGKFLGESIYKYEHGTIRLMAYRTYWKDGNISLKAHDAIKWVPIGQLKEYDFAPADIPIVEQLGRGEIEL